MKNLRLVTAPYWAKLFFCPGLTQPGVVVQWYYVEVPDTTGTWGFVRRPSHVSAQPRCITILLPWRAVASYWLHVPHRLHKGDGLACGKVRTLQYYTRVSESNFFHFSLPSLPPYHLSYLGNVLVQSLQCSIALFYNNSTGNPSNCTTLHPGSCCRVLLGYLRKR